MDETCPFCASEDLAPSAAPPHYRQGAYHMMTCGKCASETAWPREAASDDVYDHEMPDGRWEFKEVIKDILERQVMGVLLDIGCGKGGFLKLATDHGISGFGIDFNGANVQVARARGLDCHQQDLRELSGSRNFTSVSSFHVIEHLEEPLEFLEAVREVLEPHGALYLSFPCQVRDILRFMRDIADYPPHHMNRISDAGLRCLADRAGFIVVDQRHEPRSIRWKKATSLSVNHALDRTGLRAAMVSSRFLNLGLKGAAAVVLQPAILWRLMRYRSDQGFTVLYKLERAR